MRRSWERYALSSSFVGFLNDPEEAIGSKVDLVNGSSMDEDFAEEVLNGRRPVYGA
jgi:hypothetical protein